MGGGVRWVILRHILPNIVPTLLVLASLQVGLAIIAEGSLSFLGLGVPPPAPSWGGMLVRRPQEHRRRAGGCRRCPASPSASPCSSANMMGDWLRVNNDPTTRR